MSHRPVLLEEVVDGLAPEKGDVIVDGTFGGGGYSRAILAAADCRVIAIDRDETAIARAQQAFSEELRLVPVQGCFGDLDSLSRDVGYGAVNGVTLDLGVSSFQIDEAPRGFSFMRDGPLDMRMGQTGVSASDVVNQMGEQDLATIIFRLGDERQSRRIARAIVDRRLKAPFTSTLDLADVIEVAMGGRRGSRTHPATRSFQAIRMFVNDELGELARALEASERLLATGGRLAIVTFHSLEDRMVKQFLKDRAGQAGGGSRYMPQKDDGPAPSFSLPVRKAVAPGEAETGENPRARSAKLRLAVRTAAPAWDEPVTTGLSLPSLDSVEASS
jgi:16S rRNA (cytosine1402-N4)-methyltransferase